MIVKSLKKILWLILAVWVWKELGLGYAVLFLLVVVIFDFIALYIAFQIAVIGFREGPGEKARVEAIHRVVEYQKNANYSGTPLVHFSQVILSPLCSMLIPFVFLGFFLYW